MVQNDISGNLSKWDQIDRYSKWMYDIYKNYIGVKVFDIGAGIGNLTSYYINQADSVVVCDIFSHQIQIMEERFSEVKHFRAIIWNIVEDDIAQVGDTGFDTIICINVMEHLEDDKLALLKMKQLLSDNGKIIIIAPACPGLYSYLDKNVGHHRRYARGELKKLAKSLDLSIVDNRYFNFWGIVPYYLKGKFGKDRGGSFSTDLNEKKSGLYNFASNLLEPIERIIKPPIGISELIVLKKES
jgi:2-polyprenyl-3-methyl-5-hydroxy-6-metoxy-1,4-benzoquinol methylase